MASPVLLNFLLGVLLALSQRRHCEETQIRLQLIKQASERASGLEEPGNHREKSHTGQLVGFSLCVCSLRVGEGSLSRGQGRSVGIFLVSGLRGLEGP